MGYWLFTAPQNGRAACIGRKPVPQNHDEFHLRKQDLKKSYFRFVILIGLYRRKESARRARQGCKTAGRAVHCGHLLQQEEQHGNDAGGR
jgi:hypothetical protein